MSFDIREYKKQLRRHYREIRKAMDPAQKAKQDARILEKMLQLPALRKCRTVLCFVSTELEVDTHKLIRQLLAKGKRVAVPYCIDGTRLMDFYLIDSTEQLVRRTFGVLEPDPARCEKLTDFSDSLCVLPGLCFDLRGYRLGYGGGYYDRFLSRVFDGITVGICYQSCVRPVLAHGRYDVPCQYLVTDSHVRRISPPKTPHQAKARLPVAQPRTPEATPEQGRARVPARESPQAEPPARPKKRRRFRGGFRGQT